MYNKEEELNILQQIVIIKEGIKVIYFQSFPVWESPVGWFKQLQMSSQSIFDQSLFFENRGS